MQPKAKRELIQVAGDPSVGITSGVNFTGAAYGRPWIKVPHWTGQDAWLETEVYCIPGEPMKVHLICPKCQNSLTISADRKKIDYDRHSVPREIAAELRALAPGADPGGTISVERFKCTWEEDGNLKRSIGGLGLCGWSVSIVNNIART